MKQFPRASLLMLALGSAATLSSCAVFSGKPPLPKQVSIERLPKPAANTDYAPVVAGADVIYFPADRAASGARSEPSAMLLEALQRDGTPYAIAWNLIDASQQPLLDELQSKAGAARDQVIARLELAGTGRAREHCRSVLREARFASVRHLAVGVPAPLLANIRVGTISPDDEKRISAGYNPPPGASEEYAERFASSRSAGAVDLAGAYRAHVMTQQFLAEQIVGHFRGAGAGGKLLVFLRRDDIEGVPVYVAQKASLRQVILASDVPSQERRKLLTQTAEQ